MSSQNQVVALDLTTGCLSRHMGSVIMFADESEVFEYRDKGTAKPIHLTLPQIAMLGLKVDY